MKRGKLSAEDRSRTRLLDFWQHRPEYGDPIGCVTTTFTFDAAFFEEHCLSRFLGMDTDPSEDERSYLIEREEKLAPTFAAVLVDQAHVPLARSLRWHVLPMRVPEGGIFHPKITLLAWHNRIRILVGSANMTGPGYRLNFENLAALDFGPEGGIPLALARAALALFEDFRGFAPDRDGERGPQPHLRRFLRGAEKRLDGWTDAPWPRNGVSATLIATGPTSGGARRVDLFIRLAELWTFAPAHEAWVMSPFFDDGEGAMDTARRLEERVLLQRGDRDIHFIVSGRRLPDDLVEVDLPACLERSARSRVTHHVHMVTPDDDRGRPLHAKSIQIRREQRALQCIGSSNFTAAGTGVRPTGRANVEVNVAYVLPDVGDDFGRVCDRAYPPYKTVELGPNVRFLQPGDRTPEAEGHALLPIGFGGALFVPAPPSVQLALDLDGRVPAGFAVSTDDGVTLLDESGWRARGAATTVVLAWTAPRPPSYLLVTWPASDGLSTAIWPVNVTDPGRLPPPEDLRAMTLEDLIEILSSARPAHEVLGRIFARKAERAARGDEHETDPHRKVEELTRTFLLKRMRRVSAALEELRVRLEKPVYSREALKWRIEGPFGPLALADRLVIEQPDAARFLLAEVALTLRSVTPQAHGELTADDARAVFVEAEARLATLAGAQPASPNLARYADKIFAGGIR